MPSRLAVRNVNIRSAVFGVIYCNHMDAHIGTQFIAVEATKGAFPLQELGALAKWRECLQEWPPN